MRPQLVLVHAFPLGPRMWDELITHLPSTVDVSAPALHGFAGTPVSTAPADLEIFAQALLDQVDGTFVIGGCSMGGYVAMELMRRAPERLAGVILMDTKADADGDAARTRRHEVAAGVESEGVAQWVDALTAPLLGATTQNENPELGQQVRELVLATDPAAIAWAQRAMAARPDSRDTLAAWQKPALVLVGAEDELSPVEVAAAMVELLPEGELVVIPNAGHLAAWERPKPVAAAISRWWATAFPLAE